MASEYVPDFALGEDAPRNVAARLAQEALWASTNTNARQHFSVREATKLYQPALLDAQDDFYAVRTLVNGQQRGGTGCPLARMLTPELLTLVADFAMPGQGPLVPAIIAREHERPRVRAAQREADASAPFRVFVRVRPLLPYELRAGEYSSLDCTSSARALVCHDGRLARSGRRLTMCHKFYAADAILPPSASEAQVFDRVLAPLLARVLGGRGDGTALFYGQTGAGKTHTLMQLLSRLAAILDEGGAGRPEEQEGEEQELPLVQVTFFEVGGKEAGAGSAHDLLNSRAPLKLCCDEKGTTHAIGAAVKCASNGQRLLATLADGLTLRSTEATERNPISSRSHAICALRFARTGRTLRLVDLAGSERNHDTAGMGAAEHRTSAAINKALFALKECFRQSAIVRAQAACASGARQPATRVPFRASALTRVLHDCFVDAEHRTSLVAAVAPGSADMLHTFNTLDHCCLMAPHLAIAPEPGAQQHGGSSGEEGGGSGASACTGSNELAAAVAPAAYAITLDVPMRRRRRAELAGGAGGCHEELAYERVAVHSWSEAHVRSWLANAHGGRFAQVVLPLGTDGRKLLALSARRLSELVEDADRVGRGGASQSGAGGAAGSAAAAEGAQQQPVANEVGWYISSQAKIGRALFAALRDEQRGRFSSVSEALVESF